jgi:hypothetical protein
MRERFDLWPKRLAADPGYRSAENLAWRAHEMHQRGIEPHIPVFDRSGRNDGSFARSDFSYDHKRDQHICPGGKALKLYRRSFTADKDGFMRYRARRSDCDVCALKPRCCPGQPATNSPAFDPRRHP